MKITTETILGTIVILVIAYITCMGIIVIKAKPRKSTYEKVQEDMNRVTEPLYLIEADPDSLHVYVRNWNKDSLLGSLPWSYSAVHGIDTLVLRDIKLNEGP